LPNMGRKAPRRRSIPIAVKPVRIAGGVVTFEEALRLLLRAEGRAIPIAAGCTGRGVGPG
jgi:hypothetical protein